MRIGRILLLASVATAVLASGGVAWAYWTDAGGGTGSAAVAGTAPGLVLHARTTGTLRPGSTVPVRLSADNTSPAGLRIGTVHLAGVRADAAHAGCVVADFSMADVVIDQTVPAHRTGFGLGAAVTLDYADTAMDQSACQGATLTLSLTSD